MIQEITVKNFRSFKDKVTFSFEPSNDDAANRVVDMGDGTKLLRFAAIFGANASGKSNFIKVFDFLYEFWNSTPVRNDSSTGVIPFLLDDESRNQNSYFDIKFYVDKTKYCYKLELDRECVKSEILLFYKGKAKRPRPTKIFERSFEDGRSVVVINPAVAKLNKSEIDAINVNCWKNMSLFAAFTKVNVAVEPVERVVFWIGKNFLPIVDKEAILSGFAKNKLKQNSLFRDYMKSFLKKADSNILDVDIKENKIDLTSERIAFIKSAPFLDDASKAELIDKGSVSSLETDFIVSVMNEGASKYYHMPEALQSAGTIRMIDLEATIFTALNDNAFLPVDEIEMSLHPMLLDFVITEFLRREDSESQLLVATHYDPLIAKIGDLFGKDSVWFTEKMEDGRSELYPLSDFNGLNRLSSIHKAYMNGQFGGVPEISY